MKSFSILRTNVGLTTNVKLMVDSQYNLSLDSIDSVPDLTNSKFKKLSFNKNNYYDELVPYLWKGLSSEIAFSIKYDKDNDSMTDNFASQYDEIYQYGARNIINNKNYTEEYEYFAPLYLHRGDLPSNFIVFRVDGPGLLSLDKFNFSKEITKKFKTVKLFDLSKKTNFGEWIETNFIRNNFFPEYPFEMNFDRLEFSEWNGIDYKTGGYTTKSLFLDDFLEKENEIFDFEKFVFDNYKQNEVIFPNILNFSFLFDDNPATSDTLRKWSINRYYGFYLNKLDLVKTISPYIPPKLKSDVKVIEGNILSSADIIPFKDGWDDNKDYYIEYLGEYYKVEKFTEDLDPTVQSIKIGENLYSDSVTSSVSEKWRIISDINLFDKQDLLNNNIAIIDSEKRIVDYDNNKIEIKDYDNTDVWIIEIDGMYHNLIKEDGYLKVYTDYSFNFTENEYTYWINKSDPTLTKMVNFKLNKGDKPKKFSIYKLDFTDIKDFDDKIVDTEYSKFEYEKSTELTDTDEPKMYLLNLNDKNYPQSVDEFFYKNNSEHIPVSSEYTANHEIFKIENNDLTQLWRKNPVYCRWAYNNSLSGNDYPYPLNNSKIFEKFNKTVNPFENECIRGERNLDYFYTINSSTFSYLHHTLHIENNTDGGLDNKIFFDFNKYLAKHTYVTGTNSVNKYDLDYFKWFFERKTSFLNNKIKKNVTKYSNFNVGGNDSTNSTLFRGIKFSIYDVENIRKNSDGNIDVINTKNTNNYDDYKFSVLLTSEDNGMEWQVINKWEMEKTYASGSVVLHDDILYQAITDNVINEPSYKFTYLDRNSNTIYEDVKSSPYSSIKNLTGSASVKLGNLKSNTYWRYYTDLKSPLWNPSIATLPLTNPISYNQNSIVYNGDEWYSYNSDSNSTIDFWNPYISLKYGNTDGYYNGALNSDSVSYGYQKSAVVIYKGDYYESLVDNNYQTPDYNQQFRRFDNYEEYLINDEIITPISRYGEIWSTKWKKIDKPTSLYSKWNKIPVWNPGLSYNFNDYVVHDDIVYLGTYSNPVNGFIRNGEEPGTSPYWSRFYSLEGDTDYVYGTNSNPYVIMNDELYKLTNNPSNKTLENGIKIYINKKWENVLVNIFVNDNTLTNLKDADRDDLYLTINKKLTAKNFIDCINNLTNKYDFSDYVKYIFIEKDLTIKEYDYNNIESLPTIIFSEKPTRLNIKVNSLIKKPINVDKLKPYKSLTNGVIESLDELNYYNGINIANTITDNLTEPLVLRNYHGITNITQESLYRYSGNYMPLFYELDIFKKDNSTLYNEFQLIFNTNIDDEFAFTFEKDGTIVRKTYTIYKDNYYDQLMNVIYNESLFSGVEFIFEVLDKSSTYINNMTSGYDVLSVKYKSTSGNIKMSIAQTKPTLFMSIEDSSSVTNIIFTLSATSGHPPYEYSFGYTSGLTVISPSAYSTTTTYIASKSGAVTNGDIKMLFNINVRDSYGITSSNGTYSLNSINTNVDTVFYYEFL